MEKREKKVTFSQFQKLGKVLMTPVMILPIAGILVGIGSAFTTKNIVALWPVLGNTYVKLFFNLLKAMGNTINSYLPIIFAVSVAIGYAEKEKGIAALSSVIGFLAMNNVMNILLTSLGILDPAAMKTGQSMVMGIASLDTGVFGGILVGLLVAKLHNKYYNIQLPPVLGIFSGTKFVPMISLLACSALGLVMSVVWPFVQTGLGFMGEIIYNAMLASPDAMFDVNITRFIMNGKVIFAMFGLPGAALAMYHCAKPERKPQVKALLIAAIIPSIFTGITEPIEYSFLFAAPLLFVVHAGYAGLAYLLTYICKVNIPGPSSFGGPFLSTIFNGIMQADKGSNWIWVFIIGIPCFFLYYFTFRFMITKFNYKTPGREDDGQEVKKLDKKMSDEMMATIIEGLGGADNIQHVDACFTRLRVKVKDKALVMPDTDWKQKTGANGVVQVADGVQIIYGAKADIYKNNLKSALNMD